MANKLNQLDLIAMEQQRFKPVELTVEANGEQYSITIQKKFKDTEIARIFTELVKRSDCAREQKLDFDILGTILILLIKHFTDIGFIKCETIEEEMESEIRALNALIDLGLFEQIVSEFDQAEIDRLSEMFEKHKDSVKRISDNFIAKEFETIKPEKKKKVTK